MMTVIASSKDMLFHCCGIQLVYRPISISKMEIVESNYAVNNA